jgi:hypothetical protein
MNRLVKRIGVGVAALVLIALAIPTADRPAQARMQYLKQFQELYPDLELPKDSKCLVCHGKNDSGKEDKKVRNVYGKVVEEELDAKNVKDVDEIKKALESAAEEDSEVDGKSFGDLIKDGKLPATEEDDK